MNDIIEKLMDEHDMTYSEAKETEEIMMNMAKAVYQVVKKAWEYVKEVVTRVVNYIEDETGMPIEEALDKY